MKPKSTSNRIMRILQALKAEWMPYAPDLVDEEEPEAEPPPPKDGEIQPGSDEPVWQSGSAAAKRPRKGVV